MRNAIVCLTCLLLVVHADAQPPAISPVEAILEIPLGNTVEVRLRKGEKLRGRLDAVGDHDFQITVADGPRLTSRSIAYADVSRLKAYERPNAGKIAVRVLAALGGIMYLFGAIALGG